jgi:hypothetical protein
MWSSERKREEDKCRGKANSGNRVYAGEDPDWVREKLAPGNEMQLQDPAATADTNVIEPAKLYWSD